MFLLLVRPYTGGNRDAKSGTKHKSCFATTKGLNVDEVFSYLIDEFDYSICGKGLCRGKSNPVIGL